MIDPNDQAICPKCGRVYCEGFWCEGVCTKDMQFCGEPTSDGDEAARCLRVWYEAHRETWWERSSHNPRGRSWEWAADEMMLGLMQEVGRIDQERHSQTAK